MSPNFHPSTRLRASCPSNQSALSNFTRLSAASGPDVPVTARRSPVRQSSPSSRDSTGADPVEIISCTASRSRLGRRRSIARCVWRRQCRCTRPIGNRAHLEEPVCLSGNADRWASIVGRSSSRVAKCRPRPPGHTAPVVSEQEANARYRRGIGRHARRSSSAFGAP